MPKRSFITFFAAMCFILLCNGMTVYAASGEASKSPSKGLTAIILTAFFIVSAAFSAFITFKIKRKNRHSSEYKNRTDDDN